MAIIYASATSSVPSRWLVTVDRVDPSGTVVAAVGKIETDAERPWQAELAALDAALMPDDGPYRVLVLPAQQQGG